MDNEEKKGNRFAWLPQFMPGVVKLIDEKRKAFGSPWVNHCWKQGMAGQPGFFYAREGALAIGTPMCAEDITLQLSTTQAYVSMLVKPDDWKQESNDGAD